jgi:GTP-binding protein HflX
MTRVSARAVAEVPARRPPRAALVGLAGAGARRATAEQSMEELAGLADAAGAVPTLRLLQERLKPDPATYLGRGKVRDLAGAIAEVPIDLVIFDNELSPAQLRNLERELDCPVIDRTQLILDIFASRARTREGKLQVELAQLKYMLPRLVGAGQALSRLGGGIGTRGPGETKLETDRRKIRQRIAALTSSIEDVRRRRTQLRDRRHKSSVPTLALVGYTNAGKTTLFNRLTGQHAVASDALFVTLDPLVRQVRLGDRREVLLSDTVGFIDRLPHTLVAAFRATLEEVAGSDLLLHVIDAASPERDRHIEAVGRVLGDVDATDVPVLQVYNKCDLLDEDERRRILAREPDAVCVSARTGEGREELIRAIASRLSLDTRRVAADLDSDSEDDRRRLALMYRHGRVLRHVATNGRVLVEAELPVQMIERLHLTRAAR